MRWNLKVSSVIFIDLDFRVHRMLTYIFEIEACQSKYFAIRGYPEPLSSKCHDPGTSERKKERMKKEKRKKEERRKKERRKKEERKKKERRTEVRHEDAPISVNASICPS